MRNIHPIDNAFSFFPDGKKKSILPALLVGISHWRSRPTYNVLFRKDTYNRCLIIRHINNCIFRKPERRGHGYLRRSAMIRGASADASTHCANRLTEKFSGSIAPPHAMQ